MNDAFPNIQYNIKNKLYNIIFVICLYFQCGYSIFFPPRKEFMIILCFIAGENNKNF